MTTLSSMHFMQGQKDCMAGKVHESGRSEAYNQGYSAQYELEQVQTYLSERAENHGRPNYNPAA